MWNPGFPLVSSIRITTLFECCCFFGKWHRSSRVGLLLHIKVVHVARAELQFYYHYVRIVSFECKSQFESPGHAPLKRYFFSCLIIKLSLKNCLSQSSSKRGGTVLKKYYVLLGHQPQTSNSNRNWQVLGFLNIFLIIGVYRRFGWNGTSQWSALRNLAFNFKLNSWAVGEKVP